MNTPLKKLIEQTFNADDSDARFEALMTTLQNEIESDEETYCNKGRNIMRAFINEGSSDRPYGAVDDLLMTLCGWTLETLMRMAFLIPDNGFESELVPATAKKVTDKGDEELAKIAINPKTFEITGVEPDWYKDAEKVTIWRDGDDYNLDAISKTEKERAGDLIHFWYAD